MADEFDAVLRARTRCRDQSVYGQRLFEDPETLTENRRTARFQTISEQFRVLLVSRGPILCETEA
jgi:hypothetical protein